MAERSHSTRRPAHSPTGSARPPRRSSGRSPGRSPQRATKKSASSRRYSRVLIVTLTFTGLVGLGVFVFPTKTLIAQWQQTSTADKRLETINQATRKLKADTKALRGDAELERIAREQYGLTRPGETQYVLVPQAPLVLSPPTTIPVATTVPKKSDK